jgi:hypothetical protein
MHFLPFFASFLVLCSTTTALTMSAMDSTKAHQGFVSRSFAVKSRKSFLLGSVQIGALAVLGNPLASRADLPPCKPLADNCRSSSGGGDLERFPVWRPGKSASVAWADAIEAIEAYPQQGQGSVDGGGWKIVGREEGSYVHVEYTSKIFRFVDDLELSVETDEKGTKVCIKSSSRVGDSDLGVNSKRVLYIAKMLKAKGWTMEL